MNTNDSLRGYAVFGKVTHGMDVVDAIALIPVSNRDQGVPVKPVVIEKAFVH